MTAVVIASLVAQYSIPFAVQMIERWSKEDPTNPTPAEWLAFLSHPSLTLTYDEQMRGPVPTWVAPTTTPTADRSAPSKASGFGPG